MTINNDRNQGYGKTIKIRKKVQGELHDFTFQDKLKNVKVWIWVNKIERGG